jgi:HK97 family phage portal protein
VQIAGFTITRARQARPERRSSLGAPAKWLIDALQNALAGGGSAAGVSVNSKTALSLAAVQACIRVKADAVATMPLRLYRATGGQRLVDNEHPLSFLINEPNAIQTRFEFLKWVSAQLDTGGNAYARIYRNSQTAYPELLEPIHWSNVEVVLLDNGKPRYTIKVQGRQDIPVEASDMLHFKGLAVDTPLRGMSPIATHAQTLGINLAAEKSTAKFYKSGASLKFLLKFGAAAPDETKSRELKQSFKDVLEGDDSVAGVPKDSEVQQMNLSPQEAEYIATRKFGAEEIARIFGVPAYMIGADSQGIKSSVEQQAQDFYVQTIMPLVTMMEQEMRRKLLREDEKGSYYFKFVFNSLLRADAKTRAEFYNMAIRGGWMNANTARGYEDMNAIPEGEQYFMEANLIPSNLSQDWVQSKINAAEAMAAKTNNPDGAN